MTEFQLNEVFDADSEMLPVTNLYPKTKIPQIFAIAAPEGSVALRMCSYTGGGDVNKNVKPGDKMMHAIVLGVSEKGTLVKLKNLGGNPLGVISTMFDLVSQTVKKYKMDAVMFRIAKSKMGGQARAVQMIINRLVMSRLGGRFVILKELYDYDKKYVYVLIHRKNVDLSTVPGIPEISTELYTKVDSDVGDVYVSVKSGTQVTKAEALAATIALENDKRTDQSVIARAKISRRQAISAQYSSQLSRALMTYSPKALEAYTNTQREVPVYASGPETMSSLIQIQAKREIKEEVQYVAAVLRERGLGEVSSVHKSNDNWNSMLGLANKMTNSFVAMSGINPASEADIAKVLPIVNSKLIEVADIIEKYDGVDSLSLYRKIAAVVVNGSSADANHRESEIKTVIGELNSYLNKVYSRAFKMRDGTPSRTMEEQKAVSAYCGSSFGEINDFLIGIEDDASPTIYEKYIPALDGLFKSGPNKLAKGTILYRGNKLDYSNVTKSIESKLFYFPNFVSTSLHPIIFGGFANAFASLDTTATSADLETATAQDLYDVNRSALGVRIAEEPPEEAPAKIGIAFVIHGADKINVLIPGRDSAFGDEAEVILPRGTTLRLNKVWGGNNKASVNGTWSRTMMIEATVVPPEQIDENAELYDGEALFEGEVVKIKEGNVFMDFLNETYIDISKSEKRTSYNEAMELLAEIVDINSLDGTRFG
ncbi:hypothetical protein M8756_18145 [Lutimaribacter sp. EGI FJ00015]|nr:hypothetical protein [Lutimaribacter sp. EGI FJ00015]